MAMAVDKKRVAIEIAFALLTLAMLAPLWVVRYPPIQDLPQHLAAIRVLHSHGDPDFALAGLFRVELLRTQYLVYYLAADLLSYVLDVRLANLVLLSASIAATPYALRALLRALDRDERLALFSLPLIWNAHLVLGFLNFVLAIPLAITSLALAVELRRAPTRKLAAALTFTALATFLSHVALFGLVGIGCTLVALERPTRASWRVLAMRLAPLVPSGLAALLWSRITPAGRSTSEAIGASSRAHFTPVEQAMHEMPSWLTDVLPGDSDDIVFAAWLALVLLGLGLELAKEPEKSAQRTVTWRLSLLAPLCLVLYFALPTSFDWIWPIAPRFVLLAAIFVVPFLRVPSGKGGWPFAVALAAVSLLSSVRVAQAFVRFDDEEVGDFEEALAAIPKGRRVAGLIWGAGSHHVKFAPFIHYVAYYQAEKGGAVMFTFADFPQSPFVFEEDSRPPRVGPRWEWMPERVDPNELDWYDFVITRDPPGSFERRAHELERIFQGDHWQVYVRRDAVR